MIQRLSDDGYDKRWFVDYDKSNDFYLYEIGIYKCPSCYGYGPTIRTRDILHFVISGKGKLYINDEIFDVEAGQAFLIPANIRAYYEADAKDPWHYIWIHVGGARLKETLHLCGMDENQPLFISTSDENGWLEILKDIFIHRESELYCIGKIYELFAYMTANSINKLSYETNPQLEYVKKTIKYIQLKYSEALHMDDIAEACGLNRSYLSRLFKEATGQSVQQYLITYRLKKATELMKETNLSLQDISLAVGYTDIFTFSKAFKKNFGTSPSNYRKK